MRVEPHKNVTNGGTLYAEVEGTAKAVEMDKSCKLLEILPGSEGKRRLAWCLDTLNIPPQGWSISFGGPCRSGTRDNLQGGINKKS